MAVQFASCLLSEGSPVFSTIQVEDIGEPTVAVYDDTDIGFSSIALLPVARALQFQVIFHGHFSLNLQERELAGLW